MKYLVLLLFSITSHAKTHIPGSLESIDLEKGFQEKFQQRNVDLELVKDDFTLLLEVQYRTLGLVERFDRRLDRMLIEKRSNPTLRFDPLQTQEYAGIQILQELKRETTEKIVQIYKQLVFIREDLRSSDALARRAALVIGRIHAYLYQLPLEDRLQFVEILQELHKIGAGPKRFPVDELLLSLDYIDQKSFARDLKESRNAIEQKIAIAERRKDKIIERELKRAREMHPRMNSTVVRPGLGAGGNVDGSAFQDGTWVLTFDDGPHPKNSISIMDSLSSFRDRYHPNGAGGTFFWLGSVLDANPRSQEIIAAAVKHNFSINSHSWSHTILKRASSVKKEFEVVSAAQDLRRRLGHEFYFYRCPGGACVAPHIQEVRQLIADAGLVHAHWNVDSFDYILKNPEQIAYIVMKQMEILKHGIVLMHDLYPFSAAATKKILAWVKQLNDLGEGKMLLYTLDEAVRLHNLRQTLPVADVKNR